MKLTSANIDVLLPTEKAYKRSDGRGLYIFISPSGYKAWRLNYRFEQRQKTLSLGAYLNVSLDQALAGCLHAKKLLKLRQDPALLAEDRRKRPKQVRKANTFDAVADEFLNKRRIEGIADTTMSKKIWLLDMARPSLLSYGTMPHIYLIWPLN